MIWSVYAVSGITAVKVPNPVIGISTKMNARLGIVYRTPVSPVIGGMSQPRLCESSAKASAMTKPAATETMTSTRCSRSGVV